jgi:signal transduction histidine kinase
LTGASRNFEPRFVDSGERANVEAQLDEHLRRVSLRSGLIGVLFLAGFTALLWPTDWLVFRHFPQVRLTVFWVRFSVVVISLVTYGALHTRVGARHPIAVLGSAGTLTVFILGWALGNLGGPGQPWIHLGFPALFFSVLAPLERRQRIVLVAALTSALCLGFMVPHRTHWHDPLVLVMMSFVISGGAMVVAVGHLAFRSLRQSFYQSLALDHLERTREQERTRIARELHDELGQELTAMHLALALAQQRFAKDPHSIKGNLSELEALLKRTHQTTRNLVTELRPPMLAEMGLPAALDWLARQTDRAGVSCDVLSEGAELLPMEAAAVTFRIVQEALTNVVRHAHAAHADVEVAARDGQLSITVSDDGIGPPTEKQRRNGFGLLGIGERVTALAGRLELRTRAGGGTTLAALLPLSAGTAAAIAAQEAAKETRSEPRSS